MGLLLYESLERKQVDSLSLVAIPNPRLATIDEQYINKHKVYGNLALKLSVNNDFLYRIDSKASIGAIDVLNSLNDIKVLLALVFTQK